MKTFREELKDKIHEKAAERNAGMIDYNLKDKGCLAYQEGWIEALNWCRQTFDACILDAI